MEKVPLYVEGDETSGTLKDHFGRWGYFALAIE
jgi:hypothetical protein